MPAPRLAVAWKMAVVDIVIAVKVTATRDGARPPMPVKMKGLLTTRLPDVTVTP